MSAFFVGTNNKVGSVLAVLVPTIAMLCYIAMIVHSVRQAPAKKPTTTTTTIPKRSSAKCSKAMNSKTSKSKLKVVKS